MLYSYTVSLSVTVGNHGKRKFKSLSVKNILKWQKLCNLIRLKLFVLAPQSLSLVYIGWSVHRRSVYTDKVNTLNKASKTSKAACNVNVCCLIKDPRILDFSWHEKVHKGGRSKYWMTMPLRNKSLVKINILNERRINAFFEYFFYDGYLNHWCNKTMISDGKHVKPVGIALDLSSVMSHWYLVMIYYDGQWVLK